MIEIDVEQLKSDVGAGFSRLLDWSTESDASRYMQVYAPLLNQQYGQSVLAYLREDPRVKSLQGMQLSTGTGGCTFDEHMLARLALWYLWRVVESKKSEADHDLQRFLDEATWEIIMVVGLQGLAVDSRIQLAPNFHLSQISSLPLGPVRDRLNSDVRITCVLIGKHVISKFIHVPNQLQESNIKWIGQAFDIVFLLNCLPQVTAITLTVNSVSARRTPFGPFDVGGGGEYAEGRRALPVYSASQPDVGLLQKLYESFSKKKENEKLAWRQTLKRLAYSKAWQAEDAALDLGVAAEMMLLKDNSNKDQLSLTFRLRGAWLLAPDNPAERKSIYKRLKLIYDSRSQVAHTGTLDKKSTFPTDRRELNAVVERIAQQLILRSTVNWEDIILDFKSDQCDLT